MSVNVGVMFDAQEGMGWDEWAQWANEIEQLGFESLWRSDHLCSIVGHPERPAVEAWVSLAFLAQVTSRIRFGTLVSPITWRHPSLLALSAASVSVLSGGRLEVGIGAGWNDDEHRSFGIKFPPIAQRLTMLEEGAQVMRLLWHEEEANFSGEHFALVSARCSPGLAADERPPLIVGALSPRTIAIAARHADEWNTYTADPAQYRAQRAILEQACGAADRPASSIRRSVAAPFAVGRTDAELRDRIGQLVSYFPLPLQFPPEAAPFEPSTLRSRGWLIGNPSQIREQIEAIAAEGVHRVVLHHLNPTDHESIALIAEEVLPTRPSKAMSDLTVTQ